MKNVRAVGWIGFALVCSATLWGCSTGAVDTSGAAGQDAVNLDGQTVDGLSGEVVGSDIPAPTDVKTTDSAGGDTASFDSVDPLDGDDPDAPSPTDAPAPGDVPPIDGPIAPDAEPCVPACVDKPQDAGCLCAPDQHKVGGECIYLCSSGARTRG